MEGWLLGNTDAGRRGRLHLQEAERDCLQVGRVFSEANMGDTAGQEIHDIRANRKTFQKEQVSSLSAFCRSMSLKLSERQKQRERNIHIPQSEALVLMGIDSP